MAADQEAFQQILSSLLSTDNDVRSQAEVSENQFTRFGSHLWMKPFPIDGLKDFRSAVTTCLNRIVLPLWAFIYSPFSTTRRRTFR